MEAKILREKLSNALQEALQADPEHPQFFLRDALVELLGQGCDRNVLIDELTNLGLALREQNREREEDIVLDVMDYLTGWSAPNMKI